MEKKIVYIGLGLIVLSIIVLLLSSGTTSSLSQSLQSSFLTQNITVQAHNFASIQLNATNSSYIFVIGVMNNPANFYLFNSSAYSKWTSYIQTANSPSGLTKAISLEGNGVSIIYRNQTNVSIPSGTGFVQTTPFYAISNQSMFRKGTYYAVIDNTNGSASEANPVKASFVYLPPITNQSLASGPFSSFSKQLNQEILYGLAFFILIAAGIIVLIYGLIKKPKTPGGGQPSQQKVNPKADQQYVDNLYKNVDKNSKNKKKKQSN